jgi:transcriptional regulator with XRE-family HTH domain
MNNYARMIIDFMAEHGVSQAEMARRLQVTPATLSRWLSGNHGISKKHQRGIEFVCIDAMMPEITKRLFERIRTMPEAQQWELYEEIIRRYSK